MRPPRTSQGAFGSVSDPGYLKTIRERKEKSKVYRKHQLMGLTLAEILEDPGHKSFYMKLAREMDPDRLIQLAKDVASRTGVKNKGAYFMRLLHSKDTSTGPKKK